jgi:hypothetical protein
MKHGACTGTTSCHVQSQSYARLLESGSNMSRMGAGVAPGITQHMCAQLALSVKPSKSFGGVEKHHFG